VSSVEFQWDPDEFHDLVAATTFDEAVLLSVENLPDHNARILEAGAGSGRVLKFLADRGYHNVVGIELNRAAVDEFNRRYPELEMVQGDLLDMPFEADTFDAVVSYGVVEHFYDLGPVPALRAIRRVLRVGGTAVITVPSVNFLRRLGDLRQKVVERALLHRAAAPANPFGYSVHPRSGPFFEYRLQPSQFEDACRAAGFQIVASRPIYHVDGLYHTLGGRWIRFEHSRFTVPPWLDAANDVLRRRVPYFHNHMHLCVLMKPNGSRNND
jgi:SAM-dependent methyltransferase